MKKNIGSLFCMLLFCVDVTAQANAMDKNTVMDFFQNQQFDEAVSYLAPAIAADSNNVQLLGYAGYAHYMSDNIKEAENNYLKIIQLDSNNISALRYLVLLTKNNNPVGAMQYLRRLIILQPERADYYRSMGELFTRKAQHDSAFIYFSGAYKLSPNDYKNGVAFASVLIDRKKFLLADSIIAAGLEKDSVNIPFLKLSIRSAYNSEDYEQVCIPGERLMRLDESSLSALTQVLIGYYYLKQYANCIRVCEYLSFKGFLSDDIFFHEAKAWAKLKEYNKSNELLKMCVSLSISKAAEMYYYNLALNYESLKQYKKALTNYDTAYYLFKNPVMNYNCGRIAEINLKNSSLAQKYYSRYLAEAKPTEADEVKAYAYVKERWGRKNTGNVKK
jgi:tetratricopeptide (TPR) repeat protein